jgi:hypothetical protein
MENKHLIAAGHLHVYEGMSRERVEEIIERIGYLRAAVIGDGCLDVYWDADMSLSIIRCRSSESGCLQERAAMWL